MNIKHIVEKYVWWNKLHLNIVATLVSIFLGFSFVLSDWIYGYFTFAEYIFFIILITLIFTFNLVIYKQDVIWLGISSFLLGIHLVIHYNFNSDFDLSIGTTNAIKFVFYLFFIILMKNFIQTHKSHRPILYWQNILAVIILLIGVYITYELYSGSRIPHEVFWQFTRRDIYSYFFESNPEIIRTRSIFSEPAHLGFYLITILSINLFGPITNRLTRFFSLILSIGVFLTFSYSMIGVLCVIYSLKVLDLFLKGELKWGSWMWLVVISIFIVSLLYWDTIETTIIDRSIAIVSGQDISARMRLLDSWQYVNKGNLLHGNGIGHTPTITNIYAYILSDFGIFGFIAICLMTYKLVKKNIYIGSIFFMLNMTKGGYLSSGFWLMVLLFVVFSDTNISQRLNNSTNSVL